jgi:amidase
MQPGFKFRPRAVRLWFLLAAVPGFVSGAQAQQVTRPLDVHEASIPTLQAAMASGELTAAQLVDAYLARIQAYDQHGPALNSIIALNPEARRDAERLDQERAQGRIRGPLHGIPVIIKDNYDVLGMPTTGASVALANHRPLRDAHQIARLREAGAVILAKSNLTELAYGITSVSSLGGQTRNPYDLARNPGGSSGGTSAAVAASFAAVGWGSDTCGSIRIPSAVNNLFGLRPTKGLSSIDGILPLSHTQDVGGPLARTAIDLALSLDATIGRDEADPATRVLNGREVPRFAESLDATALQGLRIGILTAYFGDGPEEREVTRVLREALAEMQRLGAEVFEVEIPDMDALLAGTSTIDAEFKWDLADYLARTPGATVTSLSEIVTAGLHHRAVAEVLRRSDRHQTREIAGYAETLTKRESSTRAVLAFLDAERIDVLAYPSLRREVALIGEPALGNNCQLSATTGMPALTLPAGFTSRGTPVGMELLARHFEDARLVSVGYAWEQATGPRRSPATTPPLLPGEVTRRSARVSFPQAVSGGAGSAGPVVVDLIFEDATGVLSFRLSGADPRSVRALVLRQGDAESGVIVERLALGGITELSGSVRLDAATREALGAGELHLQLFTAEGPAAGWISRIDLPA